MKINKACFCPPQVKNEQRKIRLLLFPREEPTSLAELYGYLDSDIMLMAILHDEIKRLRKMGTAFGVVLEEEFMVSETTLSCSITMQVGEGKGADMGKRNSGTLTVCEAVTYTDLLCVWACARACVCVPESEAHDYLNHMKKL